MKIAMIGQSGGPTAAINASLAGIIEQCQNENYDSIYGMINGIKGLMDKNIMDLKSKFYDEATYRALSQTPAMYLGSCRFKLPKVEDDEQTYQHIFQVFREYKVTDFFYIGGNDSMDTVYKLSEYAKVIDYDIRIIGIPKTIDNDLMGTDHTPGFGSAAKYVATTMKEIVYDSMIYQLQSITIVEIMGRNAGWLTAAACLARNESNTAPDLIYLPEVPFSKENFINSIAEVFKHKRGVVIAVSEGIRDENGQFLDQDSKYAKKDAFGHIIHSGTGKVLETIAFQAFHCKVRSIELNVLQRCAMHIASKMDIDESIQVGKEAVLAAKRNETGKMVVIKRLFDWPYEKEFKTINVSDVANLEQKVPVHLINEEHNNVTPEMFDYLFPLIQGEVQIEYEYGVPKYLDVSHLEKEW